MKMRKDKKTGKEAVYKDTPNNRKLNRVGKPLGSKETRKGNVKTTSIGLKAPSGRIETGARNVGKDMTTKKVKTNNKQIKEIKEKWRKHLDKDSGPIINVPYGKEEYYLKVPTSFVKNYVIPELSKGKSLTDIFRKMDSVVRGKRKWGSKNATSPYEPGE